MNNAPDRHRCRRGLASLVAVCLLCPAATASEPFKGPFLLEGASIHGKQIALSCGGRIWLVSREGGPAEPLTSGTAHDSLPCFSPDGSCLAFVRRGQRAMDVYLLDLATGEDRRLTHHPGRDFPVGWSGDSRNVLFCSDREGAPRLYEMSATDPLPEALPLPRAYTGAISPDGTRIAYLPRSLDYHFSEFPYYRGGRCSPLWIADLDLGALEQVTDGTTNVRDPMWIGSRIYFLWDRDGRFDLYAYHLDTRECHTAARLDDFQARSAATDGRSIVLVGEEGLQVFDVASEVNLAVPLEIDLQAGALEPRIVDAMGLVQSFSVSDDGAHALVCARGDVFVVDTASGRAANLTTSSGVAEREAVLSPDGRQMAYFSDSSGEYALHVRDREAESATELAIESQPSYYRELVWSPDGRYIAFSDKRLTLRLADLEVGAVRPIDRSTSSAQDLFRPSWSPDGRYLAYARHGENRLPMVCVHDVATGETHVVTPGDCYATSPVFDTSGRYLYFLSSPNAPATDFLWNVMSSFLARPLVVRHVNAVVLRSGDPSPVLGQAPNVDVPWSQPATSPIDFAGIEERIVPIDVASHSPIELAPAGPGALHMVVEEWPAAPGSAVPTRAVIRLDLRSPTEFKKVVPLVGECAFSRDGTKIVCARGRNWRLATFHGGAPDVRPLKLAALPAPVDPAREWRQIAHEAWRIMRDYFYDSDHHGRDWTETEQHYARFLPGVRSREELNVLLRRMLAEVSVSHLGVVGGDIPPGLNEAENIGLLGADLEAVDGYYRIKRVLRSGHFDSRDPLLRSPLAQPGAEVLPGEYLLAVDDKPLDASQNCYLALAGKASRPVELLVGPTPNPAGARTVRVVALPDENALRQANRANHNRALVEELSQGQLGYFHIPSYVPPDIESFFRGYFANRSKPGLIIDQRANGGGITPDAFIELLARRPIYYYLFREGDDLAVPVDARLEGPTVLLVNEDNGSAAETFALMFRLRRLGPLVGNRTSGGGIGPYGLVPDLVDGGRLRIPARAAYDPTGSWGIENQGVEPDVPIDILPEDFLAGRDSQLEAAIGAGLEALEKQQAAAPRRPEFPKHP